MSFSSDSGNRIGYGPMEMQSAAEARSRELGAERLHRDDDGPLAADERSLRAWLPRLLAIVGVVFVFLLFLSLPR